MPIFLYRNTKTGEVREIVQSVHDEHKYVDDNGLQWEREFTIPTASVDTKWDADSSQDFVAKTGRKRGSLGDIQDKSKELSEIREKKHGRDKIKEDFYANYSKKRGGKMHNDQRKEKLEKLTKEVDLKIKI